MTHPIQPLILDEHGVLRFKANKIVRYLLDNGGIDMNKIAQLPFSIEDREQFAQLIGYSHSGASDISYFTDQTLAVARQIYDEGQTEDKARISYLEQIVEKVKKGLKSIVPEVFDIHPDDLI